MSSVLDLSVSEVCVLETKIKRVIEARKLYFDCEIEDLSSYSNFDILFLALHQLEGSYKK